MMNICFGKNISRWSSDLTRWGSFKTKSQLLIPLFFSLWLFLSVYLWKLWTSLISLSNYHSLSLSLYLSLSPTISLYLSLSLSLSQRGTSGYIYVAEDDDAPLYWDKISTSAYSPINLLFIYLLLLLLLLFN